MEGKDLQCSAVHMGFIAKTGIPGLFPSIMTFFPFFQRLRGSRLVDKTYLNEKHIGQYIHKSGPPNLT